LPELLFLTIFFVDFFGLAGLLDDLEAAGDAAFVAGGFGDLDLMLSSHA
jgi:hypothetical protein